MIQTTQQQSEWRLPNVNLLESLEKSLQTCSQKCKTIAHRLLAVGPGNISTQDFASDLTTLSDGVVNLALRLAQYRQLDPINDAARADLAALFSKTAKSVQELKDKNTNQTLFKPEDSSQVNNLTEELDEILNKGLEIVSTNHDPDQSLMGLIQLLQDSDEAVSAKASNALREIKLENHETMRALAKVLIPLLQSEKQNVRNLASDVLIKMKPNYPKFEELEETLVPLLKISDQDLVLRVSRILQFDVNDTLDDRFIIRHALPGLLDCYLQNSPGKLNVYSSVKRDIIFSSCIDLRDLKIFVSILENPDEKISTAAGLLMLYADFMRIDPVDEIEFMRGLVQLLSSNLVHVRRNAMWGLKDRRWGNNARAAFHALCNDPDPTVRKLARDARSNMPHV